MIGTKVNHFPYGPRRQRSAAQQRAGAAWVRSGSPAVKAWLAAQPKLPPGWSMRGGRLNPPKDWVWEDGKLRAPTSEEIVAREPLTSSKKIFNAQQVLFTRKKRHRLLHEVTLFGRSLRPAEGVTSEWTAIVAWLSTPDNLRAPSGKLSKFSFRRRHSDAEFQFSQENVAFAFFLNFAGP